MNISNWFKKDVVLHCYTDRAHVFNYCPITQGKNFLPDWWKKVPKQLIEGDNIYPYPTMKSCVGFIDFFKNSFAMPLWSEVAIQIGQVGTTDYKYQFSDMSSSIKHHNPAQRGLAYPEHEFQHLKFEAPWRFSCDEDIKFMQVGPFWNNNDPMEMAIAPGVLDFKYQKGANVNVLFKRDFETKTYTFEAGAPLVYFFPLTERNVKLKVHLLSSEEYKKLTSSDISLSFVGKYRTNQRFLKKRGCPFHFKVEK